MKKEKRPAGTATPDKTMAGYVSSPGQMSDVREGEDAGLAGAGLTADALQADDADFSGLDSLKVVVKGTQDLIEMCANLDHLGINASNEVHLPKIVVVGDQSAGKSSLIEAISEIRVPRSSGTCTRCPLQISLFSQKTGSGPGQSQDGTDAGPGRWSCAVKLQRLYDYDKQGCDPNAPFYPWLERANATTVNFADVSRKDQLEEILVRAQIAILNPTVEPLQFLSVPIETIHEPGNLEAKFSPNVICLDIWAPNVPSLSFYDLPGIINQTEDAGEIHLVSLVENLAEKYVRDEDVLVLLACSLEGDVANSSAARLVRKFRAVNRCVGVLTKPDRLPAGDDVDMIENMLLGKKYQVGHGYYITKQPGQAELQDVDHITARLQEKEFFDYEQPWCSSKLGAHRDRMGTDKLQLALSQKLGSMIAGRFTVIKDSVRKKREELDAQLNAMPKQIKRDESHTRVTVIILELSKMMEAYVRGEDPEFANFLYDFKLLVVQQLREELEDIGPVLMPTAAEAGGPTNGNSRASSSFLALRDAAANKDGDGPYDQPFINGNGPGRGSFREALLAGSLLQSSNRPSHQRNSSKSGAATAGNGGTNGAAAAGASPTKKRKFDRARSPLEEGPSEVLLIKRPVVSKYAFKCTTDDIRKALFMYSVDSGIRWEDNPRAADTIRLQSLANIHTPTSRFIQRTRILLNNYTRLSLEATMEKWRSTVLFNRLEAVIKEICVEGWNQQIAQADREIRLERMKPITYDEDTIERLGREELEELEASRHSDRVKTHLCRVLSLEKQAGMTQRDLDVKCQDSKLRDELGPDPYQNEVRVMAKVKAYYKFATNRLIDFLARHVQLELFEAFRGKEFYRRLVTVTEPEDGEDVADKCAFLLADDGERENRRRVLRLQKDAMDEAWRYLEQAQEEYSSEPGRRDGVAGE